MRLIQLSNISRPIIIWSLLIIIGLIVHLLDVLSSVFIIIGFSGITSYVMNEIVVKKIEHPYS